MRGFWEIDQNDRMGRPVRWSIVEGAFNGKYRVIGEFDGTAGTIFTLETGSSYPQYLVAKTPKIPRGASTDDVHQKVRKFLHEINETYRYSHHPLIHRHVNISISFGVPFLLSVKREYTLRDLIDTGPIATVEAAQIAIQLAHALAYCSVKGLMAHQDLKPDNVLLERIANKLLILEGFRYPLDHRVLICDFGMANAFAVFGRPGGSRPYMAPEQYETQPTTLAKADVFALGVVLHELVTGGLHPIGEVTHDVWPQALPEKGRKWAHEDIWKRWARNNKSIEIEHPVSRQLSEIIRRCLQADISARSTAMSIQEELFDLVKQKDQNASDNLKLFLGYCDDLASEGEVGGWPYYEQLLNQVETYFS